MRRLLNPLQWNFGPRTTATLLTWALIPLGLGIFQVWYSLGRSARALGISEDKIDSLTNQLIKEMLISGIPMLLVCLGAAVFFSLIVVRPIWKLREGMEKIAAGDLSHPELPVNSVDEVGQMTKSFNHMSASLRTMVQEMRDSARELEIAGRRLNAGAAETSSASDSASKLIEEVRRVAVNQVEKAAEGNRAAVELRTCAEHVAQAAEAQAKEVEQTAEVLRQVTSAIEQVAQSAAVVAEAAMHTRGAADAGFGTMQDVVCTMDRVRERVLSAAEEVKALSTDLGHVDEILALITDIAEQTDLLALNAAIEAARVGEHGRGFAVVAGEVRRLAERSRKAALEIGGRVEDLRKGAAAVVITMEAGTREVNTGANMVKEAGTSLERILASAVETQRQVEAISAASEEINAASSQAAMATDQLSAIAEENAATAEEMVATVGNVATVVNSVEDGARHSLSAGTAMAEATGKVKCTVTEMLASATQVTATGTVLQQRVERFKLN